MIEKLIIWNPLEPIGYGAFDEHQNTEYCKDCEKPIDECTCLSPCCGAEIIFHDLCSQCKEHV